MFDPDARLRRRAAPIGIWTLLLTIAALLAACAGEAEQDPLDDGNNVDAGDTPFDGWSGPSDGGSPGEDGGTASDGGGGGGGGDAAVIPLDGAELWTSMCASCHGEFGEGGIGPIVAGQGLSYDRLYTAIEDRMPQANPAQCVGECAEVLTRFIQQLPPPGSEIDCSGGTRPAPRRLRLLSRREYNNTISDLFSGRSVPCDADLDCDLTRETCASGACVARACEDRIFTFDAGGRTPGSVHVAGSFNGWPGTIAEGGLAMSYRDDLGLWFAETRIEPGRYEYKFVIDEAEWIQDPGNPEGAPDGFGDWNSVLHVDCTAAAGSGFGRDWVPDLPAEIRPTAFDYETHAASAFVTPTHVEVYLESAAEIAAVAARDVDGLVPCSSRDEACARTFVEAFGERAFRRPLTASQIDRYLAVYRSEAGFEAGIEAVVRGMLASPFFLYRQELGVAQADGTFVLDDWEMASALSYQFIGTMPDDALFEAARNGALSTSAELEAQARRLLDDPRSRDAVEVFAAQWLGVDAVTGLIKSAAFPQFTETLRTAMLAETENFVGHVVFESTGEFPELFTAGYSYMNEELAQLYELDGVSGSGLRTVTWDDLRRSGLMGHASILATNAHSDQSSPIRRGLFVREHLLCQEFPPPPPDAGGVPDVDPNATTRERFIQHSSDPSCNSCHQYIDELGFGFEHFDAIGAWRETESGQPIDASGRLNDIEGFGTNTDGSFDNMTELGTMIAESDSARRCFVKQYFRFARGYHESAADACALAHIEDAFVDSGLNIQEMMVAVVTDPGFRIRREAE